MKKKNVLIYITEENFPSPNLRSIRPFEENVRKCQLKCKLTLCIKVGETV